MTFIKAKLNDKERQIAFIKLYLFFNSISVDQWAKVLGISNKTFYNRIEKLKKEKKI